jgi:hypothetical protein
MLKVRRVLGAAVGAVLLIIGAGVTPAGAEVREGSVTVTSGGYEVTARVVVGDQHNGASEVPVDIYLTHNGTAVSLDNGWVAMYDSAGQQLYLGEPYLSEVSEGHLRATPRRGPDNPIGDYTVSFVAFVYVDGDRGPALVRIGATEIVTFKVRYLSALELTARSSNLPTGAVTTLAGTLGWHSGDDTGEINPVAATGAMVDLSFDPEGSAPRKTVGQAKVSAMGYFRFDTRVTGSGRWYASYAGNEVQHPATDRVTQTARSHVQASHQGTAAGTRYGATAGIRVTTTDVVTTLAPQDVRVDFGMTTFSRFLSTSGMHLDGRRGEGKYPRGRDYWPRHRSIGGGTAGYGIVTMDAMTPPGVYDVGMGGTLFSTCTKPWSDAYATSGSCGNKRQYISDNSITTLTVKRATRTSISASSKSFTGPKTITLKGSVKKLRLVTKTTAGYRLSATTPVKLYWDPAGTAGAQYKKTVYTNTTGVWTTKYRTTASGRWIAVYPGAALSASSRSAVTITVR